MLHGNGLRKKEDRAGKRNTKRKKAASEKKQRIYFKNKLNR